MSVTDKDIETGLQRLAQMAPDDSVWSEIEKELRPQRSLLGRLLDNARITPRIAMGAGLAATLLLGAMLTFYRQAEFQDVESILAGDDAESPVQISTVQQAMQQDAEQFSTIAGIESAGIESAGAELEEASDTKDADKTARGKYARHLYAGNEAMWDAMLEEEIHLVDIAILRSSPANQQKLWLYRKTLIKELAALRYQLESGKYLF
jgi:hypothetical protein